MVGDLYLIQINPIERNCTLSIHMKNDSVKNKGYGTMAEQLALKYAFEELQLENVYADTLTRNKRSRYVLTKVEFREIRTDATFCYYVV